MKICENPDILNIVYIFKIILNIAVVVAIVAVIIMIMLDVIKIITSADADNKNGKKNITKRLGAMVIILLVPSIISFVLSLVTQAAEYGNCIENANQDYIAIAYANFASEYVQKAEETKSYNDLSLAIRYTSKVKDESLKEELTRRIEAVQKYLDELNKGPSGGQIIGGSTSSPTIYGYFTTGNCQPSSSIKVLAEEPDPSCAINYWGNKNYLDSNSYVYPKDKNGKSLGAWPSNYSSIPTTIKIENSYLSGKFIWPVTPTNGVYNRGYDHVGIDIAAPVGAPIYSPVDGTLVYSHWGNTVNKGSDETAYSVRITLKDKETFFGVEITEVFLTHLSGIIYRCSSKTECNREIKKGELIGFVGTAAGTATSSGFAPHLHMSIYNFYNYDAGLTTEQIDDFYNMRDGKLIKAGG